MSTPTQSELLVWAMKIVREAQDRGVTGAVRVELHEGKIQRARTEAVEKPGLGEK